MGNAHVKPHPRPRNKKQVHWKAADRPSAPSRPHVAPNSSPEPLTLRWSKPVRDGGSPITGYLVEHRRTGAPQWARCTPPFTAVPELTLLNLEPGWRYQFRVSAENAVGLSPASETSEPLTITYQKNAITIPKFADELGDVTALENEKVEFVVHFFGSPPPKVCWFKDGFEIFSSRRTRITTESDKSVLTIHQSALGDEGEIKCTATNKAGHASTKARLTLEAPPTIRLPRNYEEGLLFEIGEVLRLKVSVAGRPTPLIFWSHNGETIQNNDRYEIEYIDKCSILKLGEAKRSDRGEYQIKAVNKIGEDIASFLVTITDKPSPPGRARVVMTLGRSVTLSWNTPSDDGGCKIGNYIVEYYRLGWNVWLKAATSRQLSTILGDLIEGSEYKFRIKAESPYGISEPSEESETVFIPDAKRGITTPKERSQSQPKDFIDEIAPIPVAAKRRLKSQTKEDEEVPQRPERNKIKSPPITPEPPRKEIKTILDRESIARELSYGSPEIKLQKPELSPDKSTASPSETPTPSPQLQRSFLREDSENMGGGSSEFMLVLYPDAKEKGARRFDFSFDDDSIPPPMSLSAPELGAEPPIFYKLRTSSSSSELLHERAMARINQESILEAEEAEKRIHEIPKIQINFKDDQELVGLERKPSRRRSSGSIVQQQLLWAQKRFNSKSAELGDVQPKKAEEKREVMMSRQRSESEEKEEEAFEKVRAKMALEGQSSFEKRSIDVVNEEKWLEEYEESLSESETESSEEDERVLDQEPPNLVLYSDEDEDTYHPGGISPVVPKKVISDEPFEILTEKKKVPDPSFKPKPILKKSDEIQNILQKEAIKEIPSSKIRSHSPMPLYRQVPIEKPKIEEKPIPSSSTTDKDKGNLLPITGPVSSGMNISAVAQLCGIGLASIVIPDGLLRKTKDAEEAKSVVDHYGDIVRTISQRKKSISSISSISSSTPHQLYYSDKIVNETPIVPESKKVKEKTLLESKKVEDKTATKLPLSIPIPKTEILDSKSVEATFKKEKSISPVAAQRSPTPQRGRAGFKDRKSRRTLSKSPSRLENWSKTGRKTSPSPLKLSTTNNKKRNKSPSPIPYAKPRPMLREIMTQTSIGLEMNSENKMTTGHRNLVAQAEVKVRSVVDYITDLAMFFVACWFYIFSNELLALPVLLVMVYRQLREGVKRRIPKWITKRINKTKK